MRDTRRRKYNTILLVVRTDPDTCNSMSSNTSFTEDLYVLNKAKGVRMIQSSEMYAIYTHLLIIHNIPCTVSALRLFG